MVLGDGEMAVKTKKPLAPDKKTSIPQPLSRNQDADRERSPVYIEIVIEKHAL